MKLKVHPHSGYEFARDEKFFREEKPDHEGEFKSDRLWKATYHIIDHKLKGYIRLKKIVELADKKPSASVADNNGVKAYTREKDMLLRIFGVRALISSKCPFKHEGLSLPTQPTTSAASSH